MSNNISINNDKKIICFLSSMHPYDDKRVFEKEARSLNDNGFHVIHIAPGDGSEFLHKNISIKTFKKNGSSIIRRMTGLIGLYKFAKSINADAYHCNEIDSWFVGLLLKFSLKSKCVFDVHEHYPEEFAEVRFHKSIRFIVIFFVRLLIRLLCQYTDRIVIAKSSLKDEFKFLKDHQVVLVQNFSPIKNFDNISNLNDLKYTQEKFKIIHLGLFGIARGWKEVMDAMIRLNDINLELTILGKINDGSEDEFLSFIDNNNLSENISYIKWMPIEKALEIVNECHVGLVTFQPGYYNHVHALPHKLFDYMGLALPVIVPNFAQEVCEIVDKSNCGLMIDVSKPIEIAKALEKLYFDRKFAEQMGSRGQKAVKEMFNWENEELELIKMYQKIFI